MRKVGICPNSKPTFAEMVFFPKKKNSDLQLKKIAVLLKKTFENLRLKAKFVLDLKNK